MNTLTDKLSMFWVQVRELKCPFEKSKKILEIKLKKQIQTNENWGSVIFFRYLKMPLLLKIKKN